MLFATSFIFLPRVEEAESASPLLPLEVGASAAVPREMAG